MPEQPRVVTDNQSPFLLPRQHADKVAPGKHQSEIVYICRTGRGVRKRAGFRNTNITRQYQPGIANTVKTGLQPPRQIRQMAAGRQIDGGSGDGKPAPETTVFRKGAGTAQQDSHA